jgi:hypothetical protein
MSTFCVVESILIFFFQVALGNENSELEAIGGDETCFESLRWNNLPMYW